MIFLHGLSGDKTKTWTTSGQTPECWPCWLGEDIPGIAVWSVGYRAGMFSWHDQAMALTDRGENVLARLLAQPELGTGNIIFVGHSLGGLVIKQLLRSAERDAPAKASTKSLLDRVRRVAFIGTPHAGSILANLAKSLILLRPSLATASLLRNDPNLRDLNLWYRKFCERQSVENLVLVETQPIQFFGIALPSFLGHVVLQDSADPGVDETPIPVDADHFSLVRISGRDSEVYLHVRDFVKQPIVVHPLSVSIAETRAQQQDLIGRQDEIIQRLELAVSSVVEATSQNQRTLAGRTSQIVDDEARRRLGQMLRSRFFVGFDVVLIARNLAASIESGELSDSTDATKSLVFAWCSRLLAAAEPQLAERYLGIASRLGASHEVAIARAVIDANAGNLREGLAALGALGGSLARTAALLIVNKQQGPQSALEWVAGAGLSDRDLEPEGKFALISACLQLHRWSEALTYAERLMPQDFERAPVLLYLAADAHIASAIPVAMRAKANAQFPMFAQGVPLGADEDSMRHRRIAKDLLEELSRIAKELGCAAPAQMAEDRALWLSLRDSESSGAAMELLRTDMRTGTLSMCRITLALQFGLNLDHAAVERAIDRQTVLTGGGTHEEAIARFALALSQGSPDRIVDYLAKHRTQLTEHLDPGGLACVEVEMFAQAGQVQKATMRFAELESLGVSQDDRDRLERVIHEASGSDPVGERLALYEQSGLTVDLRGLVSALKAAKQWQQLAHYGQLLFNQTHDVADADAPRRDGAKAESASFFDG